MCFVFKLFISLLIKSVCADTYNVKVNTEHHINLVDDRFLSFTVDPKYLLTNNEKYNSKECLCMASSLTPAIIRIAGPSTSLLTFRNTTIAIDDPDEPPRKSRFSDIFAENLGKFNEVLKKPERARLFNVFERFKRDKLDNPPRVEISHAKWKRFVKWANTTGFDMVFAVNYDEKTANGLWDPNTALTILTVAEKDKIGNLFWQLGYECKNQSIEEYLNDLETMRVITETFHLGRSGGWKVVGGDVTSCLGQESKSDFKDYVTLSLDLMDAVLLNGNSSTYELERMSPRDRHRLLRRLSQSKTPLWLTENPWNHLEEIDELSRAADWLTSLGHAARNGFSVHFRELSEEELYQPTLSFYMSLLYKNLVGNKVLDVSMEPEQAILFAHCTALRHKAVPGAVTLYGVNMDYEPARFSVKLGKEGEGGDVLQFVMTRDGSGNIVVNGRPMYFEGDIKPTVKRVRPYKTLLINLPPKSFGFWVLANTKINACYENSEKKSDKINESTKEPDITDLDDEENTIKFKRSLDFNDNSATSHLTVDLLSNNNVLENQDLIERMLYLNDEFLKVQGNFKNKKIKREIDDFGKIRSRIQNKLKDLEKARGLNLKGAISNIGLIPQRNLTRNIGGRLRKILKNNRNEILSRHKALANKIKNESDILDKKRNKRYTNEVDLSKENEIGITSKENMKLWKIIKKMHKQFKDMSVENHSNDDVEHSDYGERDDLDKLNEELTEADTNIIKTTVENLLRVLADLNKNLSRFWDTINVLE